MKQRHWEITVEKITMIHLFFINKELVCQTLETHIISKTQAYNMKNHTIHISFSRQILIFFRKTVGLQNQKILFCNTGKNHRRDFAHVISAYRYIYRRI